MLQEIIKETVKSIWLILKNRSNGFSFLSNQIKERVKECSCDFFSSLLIIIFQCLNNKNKVLVFNGRVLVLPVFYEIVLERVSGKYNSAPRLDGFEALGRGGIAILDAMALIADDQVRPGTRQRLAHLKQSLFPLI